MSTTDRVSSCGTTTASTCGARTNLPESGPGRGFLLVVDANPQEFEIPALPDQYYRTADGWTHWQFDEAAQPLLRDRFVDTMCFQRRPEYYSTDVASEDTARCAEVLVDGTPPIEHLSWNDRTLMYGYTIINEFLPGPERRSRKSGGSLFDLRIRDGRTQYRLYDPGASRHALGGCALRRPGFCRWCGAVPRARRRHDPTVSGTVRRGQRVH